MVRWCSSATSEDEAEASGSSASEQVKADCLRAVVSNFKQLGFRHAHRRLSQSDCSCGAESFGAYQVDSSM